MTGRNYSGSACIERFQARSQRCGRSRQRRAHRALVARPHLVEYETYSRRGDDPEETLRKAQGLAVTADAVLNKRQATPVGRLLGVKAVHPL